MEYIVCRDLNENSKYGGFPVGLFEKTKPMSK
jgi:hypothetical protein